MGRPRTNFKCAICKKNGFPALRNLRTHERNMHGIFQRKDKAPEAPGLATETIVRESICFCPFCGKQLPNATIIKN
jgi:hypothetical protein